MIEDYSSRLTLRELLSELGPGRRAGSEVPLDSQVRAAHSDSRQIARGDVFIALPGVRSQGVEYLKSAFDQGALSALIPAGTGAAKRLPAQLFSRCILTDAIRDDAARLACAIYRHPTRQLLTFGVTGTNGKTSTCHLLRHFLEAAGHRVVMITTIAHEYEGWRRDTPNTTPDAPLLQAVLAGARAHGATAAVIEVSAHAVALKRVGGCSFDGLVFTNLATDHQDFFAGMEAYFAAKRELFVDPCYHKTGCVAAICGDDEYGRRLLAESGLDAWAFGLDPETNRPAVRADSLGLDHNGLAGWLDVDGKRVPVRTSLTGLFNRYNLAGAVALAAAARLPLDAVTRALSQPVTVPGRLMPVISRAPFRVIVDFAHTASALASLLGGLRGECDGRLLVVFGAGGDKDPARRRSLPEVVFERADVAVITLDNPRSESPESIIAVMVEHWNHLAAVRADGPLLHVEPDRTRAIHIALAEARSGDLVILAGKGHETTQIFSDRIEPCDDHAIARAWLERNFDY